MLGGGGVIFNKVFSFERRRCEAMLGGSGGMLPQTCFEKLYCTIWCILGPILAFKILLFLLFFEFFFFFFFFNVAFADKSENKEKEEP